MAGFNVFMELHVLQVSEAIRDLILFQSTESVDTSQRFMVNIGINFLLQRLIYRTRFKISLISARLYFKCQHSGHLCTIYQALCQSKYIAGNDTCICRVSFDANTNPV